MDMTRRNFVLGGAASCAASCAALLIGGLGNPAPGGYVVAFDKSGGDDWGKVAFALRRKHGAKFVQYDGMDGLGKVLAELKKARPKYVCFVVPPESTTIPMATRSGES